MFFKKKDQNSNNDLIKVAALLIHAAKIDRKLSQKEEEIIKQALLKLGADNENIENIIKKAKKLRKSNQILDFTREVKNMEEEKKIKL